MFVGLVFCNISKQTRDACDWGVVILPVEKIGHTLVVLATDHQWMATVAFVIEEGEHIDIHLELILVQMDIFSEIGSGRVSRWWHWNI